MKTLYAVSATQEFIHEMIDKHGYGCIQLREGGVGLGDIVLRAPDEKHYNFLIREVYLNEWSSAQTISRRAKISKALQKEIDAAEAEEEL